MKPTMVSGRQESGKHPEDPFAGLGIFDGSVFERMAREMQKHLGSIDRDVDQDFEFLNVRPAELRKKERKQERRPLEFNVFGPKSGSPAGSGFSISISTGTGMEPEVKVKTFGDVDKKALDRMVESSLGVPVEDDEGKARERKIRSPAPGAGRSSRSGRPKETEEPETKIDQKPDRIVVETKVPGVSHSEDVEIRQMSESIEIRAFCPGRSKMYFKILGIPEGWKVSKKGLKDGVLTLEIMP